MQSACTLLYYQLWSVGCTEYVHIIIIFINFNEVVTRWQWLFYMYTKYEIGY